MLAAPSNGISVAQMLGGVSPKLLELIILPTEKCNFRCTYCYEDFELGKMPEAVQRGIENLITHRAPGLTSLHLSWFGGEPLIARDVILRISGLARRLSTEFGFNLQGSLTTNAYLLDKDLAAALVDFDQKSFQITLDGWREVHDQTRRRADGAGTFDVIWANLLEMRTMPKDFRVCLRVHLRPDNIESVAELCGNIKQSFGADRRFFVDFQHIRDMGGPGAKTVVPWNMKELHETIARLHALLGSRAPAGVSQSDRAASPSSGMSTQAICYASKVNSFMIRSDGRIGKCTVALSDRRNTIGRLNEDGTMEIDQAYLALWAEGFKTFDPQRLECPAKYILKSSIPITLVPSRQPAAAEA